MRQRLSAADTMTAHGLVLPAHGCMPEHATFLLGHRVPVWRRVYRVAAVCLVESSSVLLQCFLVARCGASQIRGGSTAC
jgi:hypothetical protein